MGELIMKLTFNFRLPFDKILKVYNKFGLFSVPKIKYNQIKINYFIVICINFILLLLRIVNIDYSIYIKLFMK